MPEHEQFSLLEAELDGHRLIAAVDLSLSHFAEKSSFPWFLSISTALGDTNIDGLPTTAESEALDLWEDQVGALVTQAAKLKYVGRVTWNGHRELLYQIDQPQTAATSLQALINGGVARPFAFRCEQDDSWSTVSAYLTG